eukprot:12308063-Karenia_brevis.AAC.1
MDYLELRSKWDFAGKTVRRQDARWSRQVLEWSPHGARAAHRPLTRWTDALNQHVSKEMGVEVDWWTVSLQELNWCRLRGSFLSG